MGTLSEWLLTVVRRGYPIGPDDFMSDLSRRQSGSKGTTKRREADKPEILSGVYNGITTGSPITLDNKEQ